MSYSTGLRLSTSAQTVLALAPANYSATAGVGTYVDLNNCSHCTIIIQTGAWAAGTAAVTINQATNVSAGSAKALAFSLVYTNATAASVDTLIETAVVSNTFNLSVANAIYQIEIDVASLDRTNGFKAISLAVASPGSNADYYSATYVNTVLRYAGNSPPTTLT